MERGLAKTMTTEEDRLVEAESVTTTRKNGDGRAGKPSNKKEGV